MRLYDQLGQEGREVAAWVREHAEEFAPLQILRVDPEIETGDDGDPFIRLTVVLADHDYSLETWPGDATQRLFEATLAEAHRKEHRMWTHLHFQTPSDEVA
jgi:hypothetical protein